jgi:hypothetical protein
MRVWSGRHVALVWERSTKLLCLSAPTITFDIGHTWLDGLTIDVRLFARDGTCLLGARRRFHSWNFHRAER